MKKKKLEIKFKCPNCGKYAKPNKDSSKNWDVYDMECPDCNVRYIWEYDNLN